MTGSMHQHTWEDPADQPQRQGPPEEPAADELGALGDAAAAFLAAADEAAERALSGNSLEYNLANQQQGGQ